MGMLSTRLFRIYLILFSFGSVFVYADSPVVINEIQYHPQPDDPNCEYVELLNRSSAPLDLSGWAVRKGITFAFPAGTILQPGQYLVLAKNRIAFLEKYGEIPAAIVGDYSDKLSNSGETLQLTDAAGQVQDSVSYSDRWPWNPDADGSGRSLECIAPGSPVRDFRNWLPSAPFVRSASGTPGRGNSVEQSACPPTILQVAQGTLVPASGEPVRVSVEMEDEEVESVRLYYNSGEGYLFLDMAEENNGEAGKNLLSAQIPAQSPGTRVRYYVEVVGTNGGVRRYPPEAPVYGRGWYVPREEEAGQPARNEILLDPLQLQLFYNDPYNLTRQAFGSILLDGILYDNVRIRMRGGSSRDFPKKSWRVEFPKSYLYRGNREQINFTGDYHDRSHLRNFLSTRLWGDLGLPVPEIQFVRLHFNGEYFGLFQQIEQMDEEWLARIGKDPDGEMFESFHSHFRLPSPEDYSRYYDKKSGGDSQDYTSIRRFVEGLNAQTPRESGSYLESVFDRDSLLNYTVARTLLSNADDRVKNHSLYLNPPTAGGRWEYVPKDGDLTWGHVWDVENDVLNTRFVTDLPSFYNVEDNPLMMAVRDNPGLRQAYFLRLRDALETLFREDIWYPIVEDAHRLIRPCVAEDAYKWETLEGFDAQREEILDYIRLRRQYLLEKEIPKELSTAVSDWSIMP